MRRHLFAGAAIAALAIPAAVSAQETTSVIRGTVTSGGAAVPGASVTIIDTATGGRSTSTSDAGGGFTVTGLRPGGPYTVEVTSSAGNSTVTDIFTVVGQPYDLPVEIGAAGDEIVVTASTIRGAGITSTGPLTVLDRQDVAKVASVNRDIRDLARRDPFARIEDTASGGRSISFAGVNPRFNRFSVDGVIVSDNFGLNPDANPTRRGPVPIDSIGQFSTSVAPYDVRQGNFLGGAIDAVLLTGTNEFHGTGFYSQNNDRLTGKRINGVNGRIPLDFKSESYGATLSGPIIKDKLFFMISAERTTQGNPIAAGIGAEGAGTSIPGLTRNAVTQFQNITQNTYGFDAGDVLSLSNDEDEKIVGKITWNIMNGQRFTLTYLNAYDNQQIGGNTSNNPASASLGLSSNGYGGSELLRAGIAQLNSDWTDVFSTEARFLYKSYERGRPPLGQSGVAQLRACTDATNNLGDSSGDTTVACGLNTPTLVAGVENSTQSNQFYTDTYGGSLQARLNLGDHDIRVLGEYQQVRIFNLFFQNTLANYYFDSLQDYQNRTANQVIYANALSGNPNDTAADFKYSQWTFGLQDNAQVTDRLNVSLGVRFDLWGQRDFPAANPAFLGRYGFTNTTTLKGRSLFSPRVGFDWEPIDDVTIRGGYGVFGGGTPDVYLANSFQNSGVGNNSIDVRRTGANAFTVNGATLDPVIGNAVLNNVTGTNIPAQLQTLLNTAATSPNTTTAPVNALADDFKVPSVHKFTLSGDWTPREFLGGGWRFGADYYFSRTQNSIVFTDLRSRAVGVLPDGRQRFNALVAGNTNTDIIVANGGLGRSHVGVIRAEKSFDWGLSAGIAYSLQDVKDQTPATSSTAGSNYGNGAFLGNQAAYGTANDQVAWSFKYNVGFDHKFFGDYRTIIQLFGETQAGRPYSYTMEDVSTAARSPVFGLTGRDDRYLLYVPTGANDPLVSYDTAATQASLENLIGRTKLGKYRGGIAPRNIARARAYTRLDLHLEQELPLPLGARFSVWADVENLPNLINKNWGGFRQALFPYVEDVVRVQCLSAPVPTGAPLEQGRPASGGNPAVPADPRINQSPSAPCAQYRYSSYLGPNDSSIETRRSLYFVRIGARLSF